MKKKMKNEKKKRTEPEMGYCPFEHWLGTRTGVGAGGGAGCAGRGVRRARGTQARGARLGSKLCTRCTQPVLTRFDSVLFLSQFLDIVREPSS